MDYEQKLAELLENIANVASENVPIFVEQYCKYTIVSNSLTIFFITVMLTFLLYELIKTFLISLASAICNISSTKEEREELLKTCREGLGVYTYVIAGMKEE